MLLLAATGTVKDFKLVNGKTKFLAVKIAVRESGFGVNAGKIYTKTIKAIVFGKAAEALNGQLQEGTPVRVVGRPEVELYESGGQTKSVLKCVGQLEIELFSSEEGQHSAPAAPQSDSGSSGGPDPDSSVPF